MPVPVISTDAATHIQTNDGSTAADTGSATTGAGAVTRDRVDAIIPDAWLVTLGALADAAAASDTGSATLMALVKRLMQKLTTQLPAALGGALGLRTEGTGIAATVTGGVLATQGATDSASGTWTWTTGDTSYHTIIAQRNSQGVKKRGLVCQNNTAVAVTFQLNFHAIAGSSLAPAFILFSLPANSQNYISSAGIVTIAGQTGTVTAGAKENLDAPANDITVFVLAAANPANGATAYCEIAQAG